MTVLNVLAIAYLALRVVNAALEWADRKWPRFGPAMVFLGLKDEPPATGEKQGAE